MRHRVGILALFGLAALGAGPRLLACGDKFLVAGRGARFQRGGSHGAAALSVLVYAPPSSTLAAGRLGKVPVDGVLSRAGYRPSTVATPQELESALKGGKADIVIASAADAPAVERSSTGVGPRPTIVPVLDNATRQEVADARRTWGVVLRSPASSDALLDAVDEAAERHAKAKRSAGAP